MENSITQKIKAARFVNNEKGEMLYYYNIVVENNEKDTIIPEGVSELIAEYEQKIELLLSPKTEEITINNN